MTQRDDIGREVGGGFRIGNTEMATHSSVLAWRIPGTGSLVGCRLWGRTESDTTEATLQQQQHLSLCGSEVRLFSECYMVRRESYVVKSNGILLEFFLTKEMFKVIPQFYTLTCSLR